MTTNERIELGTICGIIGSAVGCGHAEILDLEFPLKNDVSPTSWEWSWNAVWKPFARSPRIARRLRGGHGQNGYRTGADTDPAMWERQERAARSR